MLRGPQVFPESPKVLPQKLQLQIFIDKNIRGFTIILLPGAPLILKSLET